MKEAFNLFDKDKSGFIDAKELKSVMNTLGEKLSDEEISAMIKAADLDGNGTIEYEEFVKMMKGHGKWDERIL